MSKFVHVDITADEPERAADFYARVFGWSVTKLEGQEPYWLLRPEEDDPDAVGAGIGKRTEPWQSVAPTISVESVDECVKKIQAAGGKIVIPRVDMPGVGALVTFKDTEGNILLILEPTASSS